MGFRHKVTAPTNESSACSKRGCSPSTNPTFLTARDYGPTAGERPRLGRRRPSVAWDRVAIRGDIFDSDDPEIPSNHAMPWSPPTAYRPPPRLRRPALPP
jgi:hypothetical protein